MLVEPLDLLLGGERVQGQTRHVGGPLVPPGQFGEGGRDCLPHNGRHLPAYLVPVRLLRRPGAVLRCLPEGTVGGTCRG
ncbi:hypothetical protein GCM10027590_28570 [Nocardiopsis nanhaiensis]